jgi:RimJ/RimL family protein N-acetyltransferase
MAQPRFLDGDKVYLRPLDMNDLETFCTWFNNPELRKFLLVNFPITKELEKEILEKMLKDENSVVLSIVAKENDKLIGNIGLLQIDKVHRKADFGIAIGEVEYVSKGYGTEAMKLIINYGFKTLNLHRIELFVHEFNERAIEAYKKVGFIEEGRKREAFYSDGKYYDEIIMSILKEEWIKM